jgi:hypothetical protein
LKSAGTRNGSRTCAIGEKRSGTTRRAERQQQAAVGRFGSVDVFGNVEPPRRIGR